MTIARIFTPSLAFVVATCGAVSAPDMTVATLSRATSAPSASVADLSGAASPTNTSVFTISGVASALDTIVPTLSGPASTPGSSVVGTDPAPNNDTTNTNGTIDMAFGTGPTALYCDGSCVHFHLFHTGYVSAAAGIKTALESCDAVDWCLREGSCPDAINTTLTAIPPKLIAAHDLDIGNMRNITIVSIMAAISSQAIRMGMSWTQSIIEQSPIQCQIWEYFRIIQWYLASQEGLIDYDADQFDEGIAKQTSDSDLDDNDVDHIGLTIGLPFRATP